MIAFLDTSSLLKLYHHDIKKIQIQHIKYPTYRINLTTYPIHFGFF